MKLGFYGLVGPNLPIASIQSLYSLFTGNGVIQGAFINKGITPVQYTIPTEKNCCSLNTKSITTLPFHLGLHTVGMVPNPIGVANTAFLQTGNKQYVLFERDLPYEIKIDVPNQTITTLGRKHIHGVKHLSGHSKVVGDQVHSLEYSISKKVVTLLTLNANLKLMKRQEIKTTYIPLVHDFVRCGESTLFTESPIEISPKAFLQRKFPIVMQLKKPTYIHHVHDKTTRYYSPLSFFIFHYADVVETHDAIEIYAPVYYHLDFNTVDVHGIYSKVRLDKRTCRIAIQSTFELEKYNLDFPVKWKDYIILRNIKDKTINGFVFCKGLEIHRTLFLLMSICGEPSIVEDTLVCLGYDTQFNSYLIQVDLNTNEVEYVNMNQTATLGFHSIFIESKKLYT
jgi:carotenoid cleavage dioxygenase-like enzyme